MGKMIRKIRRYDTDRLFNMSYIPKEVFSEEPYTFIDKTLPSKRSRKDEPNILGSFMKVGLMLGTGAVKVGMYLGDKTVKYYKQRKDKEIVKKGKFLRQQSEKGSLIREAEIKKGRTLPGERMI